MNTIWSKSNSMSMKWINLQKDLNAMQIDQF